MAKIKERKSESWKPSINHDDGFISKNKKRKEKRMSLNLSAKKIDTDEYIPLKKSSLAFNKTKKDADENSKQTPNKFSKFSPPSWNKGILKDSFSTPKGKKENTHVSTPYPKKFSIGNVSKANTSLANISKGNTSLGNVKANTSLGNVKANTPKNAGTPKKLNDSKLASKRKVEDFIDDEAEEGEEPITSKDVKPYVKGESKRKKSISFKIPNDLEDSDSDDEDESFDENESSDDSDAESDEANSVQDFLDQEASEGEETDDDDEENEDDDEDDEEEDDENESEDEFKNFMINDDEGEESDEDSSDGDEEDDDDSEEDEEEKSDLNEKSKIKPQKQTPTPVVNGTKKAKIEKPEKEAKTEEKKPKVETKVAEKKPKEQQKPAETAATDTPSSNYAGFIRSLPKAVTIDQIKQQLTTKINAKNIVSIAFKKNNNNKKLVNCVVYLTDEYSLEKLLNEDFAIEETKFKVYKARENPKVKKDKPVAFMPRVPLTIKDDVLKAAIEGHIGVGKIIEMKPKKIAEKFKTRNVLLTLPDEETLKKVIYKGSYNIKGTEVIVRQAFESGYKVPMYKVVFSLIPENTTEAAVQKAIESSVGKGSVLNVKFSFHKNSYAFVTMKDEEAQKKALQVGNTISIKGTKLNVLEYKPREPKKRAAPKKKEVDAKKPKLNESSETETPTNKKQKKRKNKKTKTEATQKGPASQPTPKKENAQNSPKKKEATQNGPASQPTPKKGNSQPPKKENVQNSPKKDKKQKLNKGQVPTPEKKANLSNKIQKKKDKLKEKKLKKKQKPESN